ncbi:MAG: LPXTG cell wall anchor domain-containing protein, partial [Thomasclavelia sp.]|nr:LPXTG cell wall anchor domain-containing protein [Thomasclavelia sp.]
TVTTTVTVSLRGNGTTNTDKKNSIPEMGSNDTIKKTGGSAYTEDEVKTMTSLVAKDKDGNDLDLSKVVITQSDLDKLNDAKTAGKTGDFPITYTYTDEAGNKTTVTSTVSLRDNATTGAQGTSTAEQGGNDKTLQDSDGTVTNEDLINKCQVVAINKNGAKVDTSTLTPNQEQLDKINTMITANRDGTYPMSWTTPDGEVIEVNITLVPTYSAKSDKIGASDFSHNVDDGEITPSKALELAKVELSGDRKIDLTNVTVDQTQLDYINQMIKEGKLDSYPLTFTDNLTGETVTINVTLTKTEVPVVEEKDPTITSTVKNGSTNGSSTSKVKTGDNVNISTYVLLGIIGLSGLVLIRKKKEN